jgi:hypothetical protein
LGYHAGAEEGKLLQIGPATCALLILKLQLTSFGLARTGQPDFFARTGRFAPKTQAN